MKSPAVKWPTKVKKFGIVDPILKFVVSKYEKEIPWQSRVKNQETLLNFIKEDMLTGLYLQANLTHFIKRKKGFFITRKDVDLNNFFEGRYNFKWKKWKKEIEEIRYTKSVKQANDALANKINKIKERRFSEWKNTVNNLFPNEPHFALVFLRAVFEMFGNGIRNYPPKPNKQVIIKINTLLKKEAINININIAKMYFDTLNISSTNNGWHFVTKECGGIEKLSYLSIRSGWCTLRPYYAHKYLHEEENTFYILKINGKSEVALRLEGQYLVEIRGEKNYYPYCLREEIAIFSKIMNINTEDHPSGIHLYFNEEELAKKDFKWWERNRKLFPFSVYYAPDKYKKRLMTNIEKDCIRYANFPNYDKLINLAGINKKDINREKILILENPLFFNQIPDKEQDKFKGVCIRSWINKVNTSNLSVRDIKKIPSFVWENKKFLQLAHDRFPLTARDIIRESIDNSQIIEIEKILKPNQNEPYRLTVIRTVNTLIKQHCGWIGKDLFPNYLKNRQDFNKLEKDAWLEILKADPSFYFYLSSKIKKEKEFIELMTPKRVNPTLLEKWKVAVYEKPWILRLKNGIPKSLRWHPDILQSYKDGCINTLIKTKPIWSCYFYIENNRVYFYDKGKKRHIPSIFLNDENFINKLGNEWIKRRFQNWYTMDRTTKNIPSVQYSALKALEIWITTDNFDIKTAKDILFAVEVRVKKYIQSNKEKPYFYNDMLILLDKLKIKIRGIGKIIKKAG